MKRNTNQNVLSERARLEDVSVLTIIRQALERTDGNVTAAAKILNVSPQSVYYHLQRAGASVARVVVRETA